MIKLIFILVVRFASSESLKIEAHDICVQAFANNPNQTYYDLATGINCIPPGTEFRDFIFKNGFEGVVK